MHSDVSGSIVESLISGGIPPAVLEEDSEALGWREHAQHTAMEPARQMRIRIGIQLKPPALLGGTTKPASMVCAVNISVPGANVSNMSFVALPNGRPEIGGNRQHVCVGLRNAICWFDSGTSAVAIRSI